MMDFLIISSVILFLAYLQIGIYIASRNVKNPLNVYFFLLCLCFCIWSFSYIFVYTSVNPEDMSLWVNRASIGYLLFPAMMVGFYSRLCNYPAANAGKRLIFYAFFISGVILLIVNLTGSLSWYELTRTQPGGEITYNPLSFRYIFLYLYLFSSFVVSFYSLNNWRKRITEKREIYQFRLVYYPLLSFIVLIAVFDLILPALFSDYYMPYIGHILSAVWIAGISISVTRYQFLGNLHQLIGDQAIDHVKEIFLFADTGNTIIRTNRFTRKMLQANETTPITGTNIKQYFINKEHLINLLNKVHTKTHFGPVNLILKGLSGNELDANLYFLSVRNNFDDILGYVIYGHDNRESLNLQKEIIIRQHAEKNLRAISEILETRVKERTNELANSYKELQVKMTERMRVEEQIKADISEKEILINEIHNRVKNNMNVIISIIQTQNKTYLGAKAFAKFEELAQRVRTLLLIHQNLYLSINYSDVDFAGFIKTIAQDLLVMYKKQDIVELRIEASDVFLDVDYAIPLGIIVNELITNAMQHGFSTYFLKKNKNKKHILHIKYTFEQPYYEVSISENGKGFPQNFSLEDLTTNGLPLVEILVKDQINGEFSLKSSSEGSSISITFHAEK